MASNVCENEIAVTNFDCGKTSELHVSNDINNLGRDRNGACEPSLERGAVNVEPSGTVVVEVGNSRNSGGINGAEISVSDSVGCKGTYKLGVYKGAMCLGMDGCNYRKEGLYALIHPECTTVDSSK